MATSKFRTQSAFAPKQSTVAAKQPRTKRVVAEHAQAADTARVEPINIDAQRIFAERVAQAQDDYLFAAKLPSGTRQLIAFVASFLTYAGLIYWGIQFMNVAMIAAAVMSGSAFMAFIVGLLAAIVIVHGAIHSSWAVYKFVLDFSFSNVASVGSDIKLAAKSKVTIVTGWFKRNDSDDLSARARAYEGAAS